jgi:hypothetical protein
VARRRRGKYKFNKSLAATQSAWIQKRARVAEPLDVSVAGDAADSNAASSLLCDNSGAENSASSVGIKQKSRYYINITRYKVG